MTDDAKRTWQWRLIRRARPQYGSILILLCIWPLETLLNLLKPWPLKLAVDYVIPGRPLPGELAWIGTILGPSATRALGWLTLSTLLLFLLGWVARVVYLTIRSDCGGRMTYSLAADVFSRLQRMSLQFHNRQPTGDLVKRVAIDCRSIQEWILDVCLPAVTTVGTLLVMLVLMWRIDAVLALVSLVVVPILGVLIKVYARPLEAAEGVQAAAEGQLMAGAERTLTALPIIQAFGREDGEAQRFAQVADDLGRAYLRKTWIGAGFRLVVGAPIALGTALIFALGGSRVVGGQILLGDLLLFLSYLAQVYKPLETLAYLSTSYASAAARSRRVFELIDSEDHVKEVAGAGPLPVVAGTGGRAIGFERVSFSYAPGHEVLHDIDLSVAPGETVAFVGPTGAGKTTIMSLVLRLFDPDSGRVTVDGADIRRHTIASVRDQVAIVLQEPFLFPMSVAENIAYGRPDAARPQVEAAARAAHAHDFILALPDGYDTIIGERGATLSGGQRQRLAIARAFLKDAQILILDEPTSALDTQTEALVLDATRRLIRGRTTLIIGHRLSTVRHADRIVVLKQGRIVEIGAHDDLIAAGGLYFRLYSAQATGAGPVAVGEGVS